VVVAVITMRVVQVLVHEVIDVVAVGNLGVATARAVDVTRFVIFAIRR
jgi:hypothetical protein